MSILGYLRKKYRSPDYYTLEDYITRPIIYGESKKGTRYFLKCSIYSVARAERRSRRGL